MVKSEQSQKKINRQTEFTRLSKDKQAASVDIKKRIDDEGVIGFFTNKFKEILNKIFKTEYETVASKTAEFHKIKKEIQKLVYKDFSPLQREIIGCCNKIRKILGIREL